MPEVTVHTRVSIHTSPHDTLPSSAEAVPRVHRCPRAARCSSGFESARSIVGRGHRPTIAALSVRLDVQVYLPIFQTAGSVEDAVNLIQDHVRAFDSEEDPARRGQHETALRRKIAEDVTVR